MKNGLFILWYGISKGIKVVFKPLKIASELLPRAIFLLLVLNLILLNSYAIAEEDITGGINIPLTFPQKYNAPMKSIPILEKPTKVSGKVSIGISKQPTVDEVNADRYLVEYFVDDTLVFSTKGENIDNLESPTFDFILDTTQYKNGSHKIIVNFWDKDGSSAIGMRNIIIENSPEGE